MAACFGLCDTATFTKQLGYVSKAAASTSARYSLLTSAGLNLLRQQGWPCHVSTNAASLRQQGWAVGDEGGDRWRDRVGAEIGGVAVGQPLTDVAHFGGRVDLVEDEPGVRRAEVGLDVVFQLEARDEALALLPDWRLEAARRCPRPEPCIPTPPSPSLHILKTKLTTTFSFC